MRITLFFLFFFLGQYTNRAQEGFQFLANQTQAEIPFQLINNLIFIPITVNGVELNFLLDTGVEETLLFSLDDKKELNLFNVDKIQLRGLGSNESIEGLKSSNNYMFVRGLVSTKQIFYIILDQNFNLSSHIGIPVNGIIGTQFFKNNLVEIDYLRKKISVSKPNPKYQQKLNKQFVSFPVSIEKAKPYFNVQLKMQDVYIESKMLIDIGNSDAIWIFQNYTAGITVPEKNFDDFLGKGFSGDIEGKRAKISELKMANFKFSTPIVAFPDSSSLKHVKMVENRVGSIGAEIFRRFRVVFDYERGTIYLKKNANFKSHFKYNKSGIEIEQNGLKWVEDYIKLENNLLTASGFEQQESNKVTVRNEYKYKFELKPNYVIANIRKKSAAEKCGLKVGDEIVSIGGTPVFRYTLQKINSLFMEEDEKSITMVVLRDKKQLKFAFKLENEL
ncbi:PDZ domain-containing protein [Flavobacterium sp. TSSA_36]|uniref:retropepsin-like aspartic protease n=1 Tax=Flavobacterium sp. TSSA_36 TaxID=3447669 RepID=UPI003F41433C